jgi:hypothetical protein
MIRLTRFRRILLVITVAALVLGLWQFTDSLREGGSWLQGKQHGTNGAQPDAAELRLGRKRERLADSNNLTHMKERWKAMAPSMRQMGQVDPEDMLARKQLARESVQRLLCGSETLELVKYIEELEIPFGGNYLDEAVAELMRSPRAAEARASLLSVQDGPKIEAGNHLDGLLFHLDSWCFEAGKGCSDEEFDQFFAAMKDEKSKFNAMLGRNLTMADTDAQQAVSSTLQILKDHDDLRTSDVSLSGQVKKLRPDSDFKEIEKLFPVENAVNRTDYSPIWSAYNEVFKKWAAKDPAEAANYVMDNPERTGDDKISIIAEVVARKDPVTALEWVQNFPEGPYFDKAASGIISSLNNSYPNEALDLAALIGDPKLREEAISITKIKQQRAEQEEKIRAESKGENR